MTKHDEYHFFLNLIFNLIWLQGAKSSQEERGKGGLQKAIIEISASTLREERPAHQQALNSGQHTKQFLRFLSLLGTEPDDYSGSGTV